MCFPALLPRSSHFPFSHFMVGFLVRVVESTRAMRVTSAPAIHKQRWTPVTLCNRPTLADVPCFCTSIHLSLKPATARTSLGGFSTKSPVSSVDPASETREVNNQFICSFWNKLWWSMSPHVTRETTLCNIWLGDVFLWTTTNPLCTRTSETSQAQHDKQASFG